MYILTVLLVAILSIVSGLPLYDSQAANIPMRVPSDKNGSRSRSFRHLTSLGQGLVSRSSGTPSAAFADNKSVTARPGTKAMPVSSNPIISRGLLCCVAHLSSCCEKGIDAENGESVGQDAGGQSTNNGGQSTTEGSEPANEGGAARGGGGEPANEGEETLNEGGEAVIEGDEAADQGDDVANEQGETANTGEGRASGGSESPSSSRSGVVLVEAPLRAWWQDLNQTRGDAPPPSPGGSHRDSNTLEAIPEDPSVMSETITPTEPPGSNITFDTLSKASARIQAGMAFDPAASTQVPPDDEPHSAPSSPGALSLSPQILPTSPEETPENTIGLGSSTPPDTEDPNVLLGQHLAPIALNQTTATAVLNQTAAQAVLNQTVVTVPAA